MKASMNLMRRLPPNQVPKNLGAICSLIENEDTQEDIQVKTDQPLEMHEDADKGIDFLGCEYNKDGDSYRSPWSNKYYPAIDDPSYTPFHPSGNLLEMEVKANDVFTRYAKLYYDKDFVTSVYFFESGADNGFGSCWLVKKTVKGGGSEGGGAQDSTWDAIHVCNHTHNGADEKTREYTHTINTTVFLMMSTNNDDQGKVEVAGNATRVLSETVAMDKLAKDKNNFILASIGKLIEQNETQVRRDIKGQLLDKSKLIINTGRLSHEYKMGADSAAFQAELMAAVAGRK